MQDDHSDDRDYNSYEIQVEACYVDIHRHKHPDQDEYDADGFELVFHGVSFRVAGGSRSPRPECVVVSRVERQPR